MVLHTIWLKISLHSMLALAMSGFGKTANLTGKNILAYGYSEEKSVYSY
jgi:hypothetical protein